MVLCTLQEVRKYDFLVRFLGLYSYMLRFGLPASLTFSNCGVIFLYKDAIAQLLRRCVNGTVISLSVLDGPHREELPSEIHASLSISWVLVAHATCIRIHARQNVVM